MKTIKVSKSQAQLVRLMRMGLGRTGLAAALGRNQLTIYGRQEALVKKGVITKGTIHGLRRTVVPNVRLRIVETAIDRQTFVEGLTAKSVRRLMKDAAARRAMVAVANAAWMAEYKALEAKDKAALAV